jgi:uncharacterized membrane protein
VTRLAHARIERAIRAAESGTTGHVVVRIVPDETLDAFEKAKAEFESAGLHRAKERNVAMILVAPKARTFAVIGDRALHERVGDGFWNGLVDEMRPSFAAGRNDEAIVHAVNRIGDQLHKHFPASPS